VVFIYIVFLPFRGTVLTAFFLQHSLKHQGVSMFNAVMNIFCLLVIVSAHEYGHYYFASKYGVFVQNFSVGLGWEIFGFTNKKGTRFSFRAIPFGGYVQFGNEDSEDPLKFLTKWQRIKIYFGGPLANLLLCILAALLLTTSGFLSEFPWYLQLLMVTIGTVAVFIFAVPATVYAVFKIFTSPVKSMENVSGPIGIISGQSSEAAASSSLGDSLPLELLVIIWTLSLAVGSFNLIPLSILDGGQIFKEVFSKHTTLIKIWRWSSGALLMTLFVYVFGTDIFKFFTRD